MQFSVAVKYNHSLTWKLLICLNYGKKKSITLVQICLFQYFSPIKWNISSNEMIWILLLDAICLIPLGKFGLFKKVSYVLRIVLVMRNDLWQNRSFCFFFAILMMKLAVPTDKRLQCWKSSALKQTSFIRMSEHMKKKQTEIREEKCFPSKTS